MNRLCLPSVALAILAVAATAHADPTKHECVEANDGGQDSRQAGKLIEARERFAVCVAASCPQPVREDCARRLEDLSKATPSVVLDAKDGAGNDLTAVHVTVDGRPLASRLDGTAVDIDPGEHRFTFETVGQATVEKTLVLHEGEKARRISVVFGAPVAQPVVAPPLTPAPVAATTAQPATVTPSPGLSGRRSLALAIGAVGVAGLAVGIGSGLASVSKHTTLDGECQSDGACPPSAQGDLNGFRSLRTVSTVGYIVGAAGLAGGAVLWLTAPSQPRGGTAAMWFGPGSVGVAGRF